MGRGQIAVFVIIGLVIVIAVGLAFYFIPKNNNAVESKNPEEYAKACLKSTAVAGLKVLGKQGTIYPKAYIASPSEKVAYYYFRGKSFFPDKDLVQQELATYIRENMDSCIFDYRKNRFGITNSNITDIDVVIGNDIMIYAEYVIDADEIYSGSFIQTIDSSFSELHGYAKSIVDEAMIDPEWINLDSISESDVQFRMVKIDKSTLIYVMTDEDGLEGEPYSLYFGMKYR